MDSWVGHSLVYLRNSQIKGGTGNRSPVSIMDKRVKGTQPSLPQGMTSFSAKIRWTSSGIMESLLNFARPPVVFTRYLYFPIYCIIYEYIKFGPKIVLSSSVERAEECLGNLSLQSRKQRG